jgi:hypothetical protein
MEQIGTHLVKIHSEIQVVLPAEQALTELKPLKNGELLPALSGKKICTLQSVESLKEVLRYCMLLVGLRAKNFPANAEKEVLIQFIFDQYSGHTVEEIKLAFDMAVAGKLDVEDVNCYENFSPIYFGKIMNAYRKWAAQQYRQEVKEDFKEIHYTAEQLQDLKRKWTEEFYQRLRNGKIEEIPEYTREILVADGYVEGTGDVESFLLKWINSGKENLYVKTDS